MAKIIQGLLLFARQRKAQRRVLDLRDVVREVLSLRETQLGLSSIRVETELAEDVPRVEGDVHQLQQVLLNLVLNAEQAILGSGVGGRRVGDHIGISTGTRRDGDAAWAVVRIMDNGPGIPPAVLPRVFEPFFTTKKVGEGAGLGLSVSYGIVGQHGGRLSVESEPGHTAFTLELPAAREQDAPLAAAGAVGRVPALGRGRRALVVDSEPAIVELVTTVLDRQGWRVDAASDERAALDRLRQARYDLILSDLRTPELDGAEFYRAAVAQQQDLAERFLFITGAAAGPPLPAPRAPRLEKPFTAQALLRAVEQVSA